MPWISGERIAERVQEILIGGQDRAVHREFDDGLRLADRAQLRSKLQVLQPHRRVLPFNRRSRTLSFLVLQGSSGKIKGPASDLDRRAVRRIQICQHLALMSRVLVEGIDAAAVQLRNAEMRKILSDVGFRLLQQADDGLVHISDVEIGIRDHHFCSQRIHRN